jgi:hypothetical protein
MRDAGVTGVAVAQTRPTGRHVLVDLRRDGLLGNAFTNSWHGACNDLHGAMTLY